MSILDTGHTPVGNESTRPLERTPAVTPPVVPPAPRVKSCVESVANYTPRVALPRARPSLRTEAGGPGSRAPVVSASVASFGTAALLEVVIDDDDRTVVPDPLELPWRHICALRIVSQSSKEYVGTGWFIGPKTVMTAGHCVYLHDDGGWPKSITVIPALNGNVEPYGESIATRFRATEGWTTKQDTNFDYGAILLDQPIGRDAGWFSFAALDDNDLETNDANIAGYPYDRDHATRQYFHARRISSLSPQKLFYAIDTFGGQSGSPIWFNLESGQRIAVGVHTTGSSTSNSGTRITRDIYTNMKNWAEVAPPEAAAIATVAVPVFAKPRPSRKELVRGGRR